MSISMEVVEAQSLNQSELATIEGLFSTTYKDADLSYLEKAKQVSPTVIQYKRIYRKEVGGLFLARLYYLQDAWRTLLLTESWPIASSLLIALTIAVAKSAMSL